jgi:hypothetical protein
MYQLIEMSIRGAISTITHRCATANNPMLGDYIPNKPDSHIIYFDANNLYGLAISQTIPYGGSLNTDYKTSTSQNTSTMAKMVSPSKSTSSTRIPTSRTPRLPACTRKVAHQKGHDFALHHKFKISIGLAYKAFFNTMDYMVGHLPHWAPSSAPPLKKKMAYCPKARALGPVLSN